MEGITKLVNQMYEKYPYPSIAYYKPDIDLKNHANRVLQSLDKTVQDFTEETSILDLGCGTGEITCSLASNGARVVGVDLSKNSLKRAKLLAQKNNLTNIEFINENLFNLNLNEKFYYSFSFGVLHHTKEMKKGFEKLVEHTKNGGYVTIGLYNRLGRFKHRLRRKWIELNAGKDFEKKIKFAEKEFFEEPATEDQLIYLADKYANPHETYASVTDVLTWFREFGIEFVGCTPKLEGKLTEIKWFLEEKTFFIISGKRL